jgi:hypothetical protein
MNELKKTFKISALVFVVTIVLLASLLSLQFLSIYWGDFTKKGMEYIYVFKLIELEVFILIPLILPFTFSITAAANCHSFFNNSVNTLKYYLRKTIPITFVCVVLCFIYKAYIVPPIDVQKMVLLYDIRVKQPNEPLQHSDVTFFKNVTEGKNYSELSSYIDTLESRPSFNKKELINEISTYESKNDIKKLLETEQAKKIGLSESDFNGANNDSINTNKEIIDRHIKSLLDMAERESTIKKTDIVKALNAKYEMVLFPFLIFSMIYSGIFFGIIMRKIRPFIYVELILLFTYLPFQLFIGTISYKLIKNKEFSPISGQLSYLGIITLITLILGFITFSSLNKKERVID